MLLLTAILAVGLWSYGRVHNSLREIRASGLQTLLNSQVAALELWIAEGKRESRQLASEPQLRAEIEALSGAPHDNGKPDARRIIDAILRDSDGIGAVAAHVIDPAGAIIASSIDNAAGRRAEPDLLLHLEPVFRGDAAFVRPHRRVAGKPLVWFEAPVRAAGGKVIAALGLGFAADGPFAEILKVGRPGSTGEALAFDADGWLLSESRHLMELRDKGLGGNDPGGVLAVRLSAPSSHEDGESPPSLTRLAATAIASRHGAEADRQGLLLDPYPGYLGREVIGVWRWLADDDMGIAVEMEAAEAYAPLIYLQIGYAAVLLLMGLVWLSAFLPRGTLERALRRSRVRQVGPYRLLRQIGEGAISNVFLAQHHLLRRPAAVKVLKPQATSDEWVARFEREVQLASRLHHPNTITIYDYGTGPNGLFYYAMEYLEGISLADLVERYGPVPPARVAHILSQACLSLAEAHAQGLVHRDIKPQNIMLCQIRGERDVVKVLDFGLVKQISGSHTRDLTSTMKILGTPLYMSPERIRNPADADARADIYALGAVAFNLLTGKRLFETETDHDLTYQVLHVKPRRASECAPAPIPPVLDELVARCVEKDPAARPQSVTEVDDLLGQVLAQTPWTSRQIEAWWHQHWVSPEHPERRFSVTAEE